MRSSIKAPVFTRSPPTSRMELFYPSLVHHALWGEGDKDVAAGEMQWTAM